MDQIFFSLEKNYAVYALCACMFSFAGIPIFGGFYSKYLIFHEIFINKKLVFLTITLAINLLSSFYYIAVIKKMIFEKKKTSKFSIYKNKIFDFFFTTTMALLILWTFLHTFFFYFLEKEAEIFFF